MACGIFSALSIECSISPPRGCVPPAKRIRLQRSPNQRKTDLLPRAGRLLNRPRFRPWLGAPVASALPYPPSSFASIWRLASSIQSRNMPGDMFDTLRKDDRRSWSHSRGALSLTIVARRWPGPPPKPPISPPPEQVITFERVPPQIPNGESGPPAREIAGRASGVPLNSAHVVVYSYTNQWYVQPYEDSPRIPITRDGMWTALIHGGSHYLVLLVEGGFRPPSPSQAPPNDMPGVITWALVAGVRPWYEQLLDFVAKLYWLWVAITGFSTLALVGFWLRFRSHR
jgi:hypothetical protein